MLPPTPSETEKTADVSADVISTSAPADSSNSINPDNRSDTAVNDTSILTLESKDDVDSGHQQNQTENTQTNSELNLDANPVDMNTNDKTDTPIPGLNLLDETEVDNGTIKKAVTDSAKLETVIDSNIGNPSDVHISSNTCISNSVDDTMDTSNTELHNSVKPVKPLDLEEGEISKLSSDKDSILQKDATKDSLNTTMDSSAVTSDEESRPYIDLDARLSALTQVIFSLKCILFCFCGGSVNKNVFFFLIKLNWQDLMKLKFYVFYKRTNISFLISS